MVTGAVMGAHEAQNETLDQMDSNDAHNVVQNPEHHFVEVQGKIKWFDTSLLNSR